MQSNIQYCSHDYSKENHDLISTIDLIRMHLVRMREPECER
jgi:hypothetical protein